MATVVRMIHVPKTGGTSALNFLSELNAGGRKNGAHFERYNIKGSPHVVVNKTKVRKIRLRRALDYFARCMSLTHCGVRPDYDYNNVKTCSSSNGCGTTKLSCLCLFATHSSV